MSYTMRLVGRSDQPTEPNASVTQTLNLSTNQTLQMVPSTQPCRVFGALVAVSPTGAVSFYDGTSTAGVLIGYIPANAAVGTFVSFLDGGMPAQKGLYASGATNVGQLTVALGL